MNMVRKIYFEIGELVLDGFNYHDHLRIKNAIENELIQLVSDRGLPDLMNGDNISNTFIDAGNFQLTPKSSPNSIGIQIAHSIHTALIRNYRMDNE